MQQKNYPNAINLLKQWLSENRMSKATLSRAIDIPYPMIWLWLNGKRLPSLKYAVIIEIFTNGMVPCSSWYEDPQKPWSKDLHNSTNKTQKHQDDKKDSTT